MSSEGTFQCRFQEDRVSITSFEVTDPEITEYLRQFDDEQERQDALRRALQIGVTTMDLAETSRQEEFVERKFSDMQRELQDEIERIEREVEETFGDDGHVPQIFATHLGDDGQLEQRIEEAFADDGPFKQRLDEELGANGERIQDALDPDREGTPTYRLKQSLQDQIERLRDKIEEEQTAEETEQRVRQQTTLKGDDFEERVDSILSDLVYGTSNELEYTGERVGELDNRKVGDFVITLNGTGQRIVVEAKSDSGYNQPDIKEELEEAIENRDADYGIIVFECESYIPNKIGYFHEFDSTRLSVALSEDDEDGVEPGFLRIGFNWAATRAIQGYADTDSAFDPEVVQNSIDEVQDTISRFSTIRSKTTSIRRTANDIDEELDEIESQAKSELTDIRTELHAAD